MRPLLCLLALGSILFAAQPLEIGEYRTMKSAIYGEEVRYFLKLPDGYEGSARRYPVLLVLNAGPATTAMAYATVETLTAEMVPEMILVGLMHPRKSWYFPGSRDGSDTLARFLAEEFAPHLEAQYRTEKYRIIYGQSNAGLFAMYAFFTRPEAFEACIAASPSLGWAADLMKDTARASLAKNRERRRALYLNQGGKDYRGLVMEPFPAFVELLRKEAPATFVWTPETLERDGHVPVASLNNGLLSLFPDFLASEELKAQGLAAVDAHFAALSKRYGIRLEAPEETLFDMSYKLLRAKRWPEAIAGFEALTERRPRSQQARLFLGDAYRDSGDTAKARAAYERCLAADPNNEQAKQRLAKLP